MQSRNRYFIVLITLILLFAGTVLFQNHLSDISLFTGSNSSNSEEMQIYKPQPILTSGGLHLLVSHQLDEGDYSYPVIYHMFRDSNGYSTPKKLFENYHSQTEISPGLEVISAIPTENGIRIYGKDEASGINQGIHHVDFNENSKTYSDPVPDFIIPDIHDFFDIPYDPSAYQEGSDEDRYSINIYNLLIFDNGDYSLIWAYSYGSQEREYIITIHSSNGTIEEYAYFQESLNRPGPGEFGMDYNLISLNSTLYIFTEKYREAAIFVNEGTLSFNASYFPSNFEIFDTVLYENGFFYRFTQENENDQVNLSIISLEQNSTILSNSVFPQFDTSIHTIDIIADIDNPSRFIYIYGNNGELVYGEYNSTSEITSTISVEEQANFNINHVVLLENGEIVEVFWDSSNTYERVDEFGETEIFTVTYNSEWSEIIQLTNPRYFTNDRNTIGMLSSPGIFNFQFIIELILFILIVRVSLKIIQFEEPSDQGKDLYPNTK